jgi:hypothetical protein
MSRNKRILGACFAFSFCLHLSALGAWQRYCLWFVLPTKLEAIADWVGLVGRQEKDEILKTTFESIIQVPEKEEVASAQLVPILPIQEQTTASFEQPSFPVQELAASNVKLPTFSFSTAPLNLLEHLPKIVPPASPFKQVPNVSPVAVEPVIAVVSIPQALPQPKSSFVLEMPTCLTLLSPQGIEKVPHRLTLPDLPKFPTLEELETASCADAFDLDLVFVPKEDEGYIFALTLIPRETLQLPRIRQNVTFLIDRSNSVQQGRLSATKAAVHKALEELNPEDTFNIIAFDSKMEKLSPSALSCNLQSFARAEAFLERIQLGSFFVSADLYRPLFLTVPGQVESDETYTAILFTDGESLKKKNAQSSLISEWTSYNQGKVALYTFCLNDANAPVLEAASSCNKGRLTIAPATKGIKRKLMKLMKTIQTPVAKNISCTTISHLSQNKVTMLAKSLPNLYLDQPYTLLGETDTLDDFILFVQGRLKGRWINIKKKISFLNAKRGGKALRQEWAMQKALPLYERYFLEQDVKHLAEIKQLLEPFDLPMVVQ